MSILAVFPLGRSVTIAENRRGEASQRRGNRSDRRLRRTRFPSHDSGHAHRRPKVEAEGAVERTPARLPRPSLQSSGI